jgi:immune inhibitor A
LYRLAAELKKADVKEADRVVNPKPVSYAEGRQDTFWLVDLLDLKVYSSLFELRLVTPHAYWYFEDGQTIPQSAIERSAAHFEKEIYPRVTAAFGHEWSPGVDNDPHLNILNARLKGVEGYYSSSDEYPLSVNQFSNQREVIYINTAAISVNSPGYLEVLAHELQHAVHWNADPSEESWVNEGLSELSITVAGFDQSSIYRFLRSPPTSLVHWPLSPLGSSANYGAASLFIHYLVDHYGDINSVRSLLEESEDGISGINAYLETSGYDATFRDLFRDWAVANLLDENRGPYGYSKLDVKTRVTQVISDFSEFTSQIPQYAVEYVKLDSFNESLELQFRAPAENDLLPTEVDSRGCWWGNSGDSISSTLTRPVDLIGLDRTTLNYQVWFELEEDWDYGYLEVSVDGGGSWDILGTPNTTAENPIGNSFGMGYTGHSGGWIDETVDLTGYVGQRILLRFQYVTDDALNGSGICIRGMSIPEAGLPDAPEGWTAEGFVLTDNRVRQDYIVQVIQVADDNRVTLIPLDENNSGSMIIAAPGDLDQLVVAVAALAAKTRQEAAYTLTIKPAG